MNINIAAGRRREKNRISNLSMLCAGEEMA